MEASVSVCVSVWAGVLYTYIHVCGKQIPSTFV